MSSRSKRAVTPRETVEILERGSYRIPHGDTVSIAEAVQDSCRQTRLYTPGDLNRLLRTVPERRTGRPPTIAVVNATTLAAAAALVAAEPDVEPCLLNFASAKNAGGGFLGGSQAQEESLARATGLYACIHPVREYYDANQDCGTCLYTHHMIYSPGVPVIRDDEDELLAVPYRVAFLTAPAVNAGALARNEPAALDRVERVMRERIDPVLAVAAHHGHDSLVLGAWGCGVFRNDPAQIAALFADALRGGRFAGAFRRIVFAVLDSTPDRGTYNAFAEVFASADSVGQQ